MEKGNILAKLVEEDFGLRWNGGKWARSVEHDSLIVNMESGWFFWNSEGIAGTTKDYLQKVRKLSKDQTRQLLYNTNGGTPLVRETGGVPYVPYEKLIEMLWINGKKDRDYWYDRTLTDTTIDRFRLGFFKGWFTIPLYADGRFINFQCRRDKPEKRIRPWYKGAKTVLFNEDILKFTDTVYITEGLVDAILLAQHDIPSVSKNNGAEYFDNGWFYKFLNVKNIYYIADNDKAGINGAKKVCAVLGKEKVKVFRFKDKSERYDTGDWFKEGNSKEEFLDRVNNESVYGFQEGDF